MNDDYIKGHNHGFIIGLTMGGLTVEEIYPAGAGVMFVIPDGMFIDFDFIIGTPVIVWQP
jgi:hypothetical protein